MTRLVNLLEVELLGEVSPEDLREHGLGEIDELASLEVGHHVGVIGVLFRRGRTGKREGGTRISRRAEGGKRESGKTRIDQKNG